MLQTCYHGFSYKLENYEKRSRYLCFPFKTTAIQIQIIGKVNTLTCSNGLHLDRLRGLGWADARKSYVAIGKRGRP
jgi:hypothetical protein